MFYPCISEFKALEKVLFIFLRIYLILKEIGY